jgi:hypothetical protein
MHSLKQSIGEIGKICTERRGSWQVALTRNAAQTVEPYLRDGGQSSLTASKFPVFDQDGLVVMAARAGVDLTDCLQKEWP